MKKMQVSANNGIESSEKKLLQQLFFRYWPYWPMFAVLMLIGLGIGYLYLQSTEPLYESTATILIKDEKRGLDDSKTMESLNPLSSKKIVENETEIMCSKAILTEVIKELHLYAPVYEKKGLTIRSAYVTSPIVIQLRYPDSLTGSSKNIDFVWSATDKTVVINKTSYPVNKWLTTPWGFCRFGENPLYHQTDAGQRDLFFRLIEIKQMARDLAKTLDVSPISKVSTVVALKIKDSNPARGEAILNAIMEEYNRVSITDKTQLAANTLEFVDKRIKMIEGQLDSANIGIQKFRTEKGVVNLSEQSQLYIRSVGEIDQKAGAMDVQLAALDQIEKYVLSKNGEGGLAPATLGIQDPFLSSLVEKLNNKEIEYEGNKKVMGENSSFMLSLQNEIARIKPSILEIIRNQRNNLEAGRNNLNGSISRYSSMLKNVPKQERELAEMNRPLGTKNDIYTFLLQKKEEAALSYNATVPDSRLVDKAESTDAPVSPRKMIILAGALLGAFVLGIVVVLIKEVFNSKILFRSDIEAYSTLPILGEIVYDKSKETLVVAGNGRSFSREQFRQIRTSLGFLGNPAKTKKIMVTSSIAGEGKSFVAANLALSLAVAGRKVVLVDMDLYVPRIAGIFGITNDVGMTDYLSGKKNADHIIKKTKASDNLFVVPAGNDNTNGNLSELILNGKAQQLLDYLETVFDMVIIDTTPVLAITDGYTISSWCDATVYVVRHAFTPKVHVQRLDDNAGLHRLKNTSILFNGVKKRGLGKYGYGYGYGYDYDYGYKYGEVKEINRKKVNV